MTKTVYALSSPEGSNLVEVWEALAPYRECPPGHSFALPASFDLAIVRALLKGCNVGNCSFIAIRWPDVIEIKRMPEGMDATIYYSLSKEEIAPKEQNNDISNVVDSLKKVIELYIDKSLEDCQKYDRSINSKWKEDKIISYAYIQRNMAASKDCKNHPLGSTNVIKEAIKVCKAEGLLVEVQSNFLKDYGTNARIFKIVEKPVASEEV